MTKIFETERLILRTWTHDDAQRLFEICGDTEVMKYIGVRQPYERIEEAIEFLVWATAYQAENNFCRWAVLEKASGEIVGSCGFARPHETVEVELGYLFDRNFWGRGFATEAAKHCLLYGFDELGFDEVIAITDLANVASQKVLEKIGFVQSGVEKIDGEDNLIYTAKNSKIIK